MTETSKFPPGCDEERVRRVLEHHEQQSDDEALAEDEAAYESTTHTVMKVPIGRLTRRDLCCVPAPVRVSVKT